MSEHKHTKGPWKFDSETKAIIYDECEGPESAGCEVVVAILDEFAKDNAGIRIATCTNACQGIHIKALEGGVIGELVERLSLLHAYVNDIGAAHLIPANDETAAFLAKLKNGAK